MLQQLVVASHALHPTADGSIEQVCFWLPLCTQAWLEWDVSVLIDYFPLTALVGELTALIGKPIKKPGAVSFATATACLSNRFTTQLKSVFLRLHGGIGIEWKPNI